MSIYSAMPHLLSVRGFLIALPVSYTPKHKFTHKVFKINPLIWDNFHLYWVGKTVQTVLKYPSFFFPQCSTSPWIICQNSEISIGTLLLTRGQTLFRFHRFFTLMFQDPIQGTTYKVRMNLASTKFLIIYDYGIRKPTTLPRRLWTWWDWKRGSHFYKWENAFLS